MNIGDSRIYIAGKDNVKQITKDQSLAQNVLLQCVGTSGTPEPEIEIGEFEGNSTVLACSDGFWKTMDDNEVFKRLCPQMCVTSEDMLDSCKKLAERAYARNEEDNVSIAALCMEF